MNNKLSNLGTTSFQGTTFSVGQNSHRSSSTSYSSRPYYSSCYHYSPFFYPYYHHSTVSTVDPIKMQEEKAKDELFINDNPEIAKKLKLKSRVITWSVLATTATAILTRGVEITKKAAVRNINFDLRSLALSAFLGLITGLCAHEVGKNKVRTERFKHEIQEKQEKD